MTGNGHPRGRIVAEDIRQILRLCADELDLLAGRTLLLTGASGFVGSYLVEAVLAWNDVHPRQACQLLLPTRDVARTQARWPHFFRADTHWFAWDGGDLDITPQADFIIHAAAPVTAALNLDRPMEAVLAMAGMTQSVLNYARRAGARRFLFTSSGAVYGTPPGLERIPESYAGGPDLTDPRACYGEAKRYCELLCLLSGVPVRTARLFAFTGPYQDLNAGFAVTDFIRQAWERGCIELKSTGSALRTYCYASDLAIALFKLLLLEDAPALCNIGGAEPVSILQLAHLVAEQVPGTQVRVNATGPKDALRTRYVPDVARLHGFYTPAVPPAKGVARMVQSLIEQGRLAQTARQDRPVDCMEK